MVSSPQPSRPQKLQRETGRTRKSFYASSGAEHFEGKIWQKPDVFDLWAVSEKLLVSFRNILSGVVNTAFHMSREKLWDKSVFSENIDLTFFSDLEWRISGFVAEVFNKCVKDKIHVTRGSFWANITTKNILLQIFWWVFVRKICFARKLQVRQ